MSDESYSRRCALGAALVFGGWLVFSLAALAVRVFGAGPGLFTAALVPTLPLIGIGAVLAVLGWIEASTHDRSGRGLSTWALIVSAVFGVAFLAGFVQGVTSSRAKYRPPSDWKAAMSEPGSTMDFPAKGFAFVAPAAPWIRIKPERVNPRADLVFVHERKGVFFLMVATRLPAESEATDEDMVEGSQEEIRAIDPRAVFGEAAEARAGEVPGLSFGTTCRLTGKEVRYRHWVHVESEIAYQLVAWCPLASAEDLETLSQEIFDAFQLREP